MPIEVISPINIGRDGRRKGFRSLSELKLNLVEIDTLIDNLSGHVDDLNEMLAAVRKIPVRRGARKKSRRSRGAKTSTDMDAIERNMTIFRDSEAIRKQLNNARAELRTNTALRRTRTYKEIEQEIKSQERRLGQEEAKAFSYIRKVAQNKAPKKFKDFTSDTSEAIHEHMDGLYDQSQEMMLVDVNNGKLRFTYYIRMKNVEFEGSNGFKHDMLVIPLTYDTSKKGFFAAVLLQFKHPGRFEYGTHVANTDKALAALTAKLRAVGFMGVLVDDEITPFDPSMLKNKKFPGVTNIALDDEDMTLTFTIKKGIKPKDVLASLQASVFTLIRTTHPGHLLTHYIKRNKISFKVDKSVPYMADRKAIDRMAEELQLTKEQHQSLKEWFVENMTNELPDEPEERVEDTKGGQISESVRVTFGEPRPYSAREVVDIYVNGKLIGDMGRKPGKNWTTTGEDRYGKPSPYLKKHYRLGTALPNAKRKIMSIISERVKEMTPEKPRKVTFSRTDKTDPDTYSVYIFLDKEHIGSIRKASDGDQWYTYGEDERDDGDPNAQSPYLYEADLGGNLRDAKQAIKEMVEEMLELGDQGQYEPYNVDYAYMDTISNDGPHINKPHKTSVQRPAQRSVNRTLARLADHFRGNLLTPGDPLYGIAKAIPGANVDAKIVLLTKPHSVFVEHTILISSKDSKALVDHNVFLTSEWTPGNNIAHKDPSRAGEYKVVYTDGSKALYKPRKIMAVGQFIKESETYFAVRSIQLQKKRNKPRLKPDPSKSRNEEPNEETAAKKKKGGILPYMMIGGKLKVLIVHPGGPLYKNKNAGYWSIAKGAAAKDETAKQCAKREFMEETGLALPKGIEMRPLSGKKANYPGLSVWAVDGSKIHGAEKANKMSSNTFKWRGKLYPEIDEHRWVTLKDAKRLLNKRMRGYVDDIKSMGIV